MAAETTVEIDSNIQKTVIKKGKFGRKPALGWTCDISLHFPNQNKEEQKDSLQITIGNGTNPRDRLIERCVETMHLEEESSFSFKPKSVEDNSDSCTQVTVIITLKSFQEKPYIFQWSDDEKLKASNFYKQKGVELFKDNKFEEAFYKFSLAHKLVLLLDSVLEEEEQSQDVSDLRTSLYNNLAGCHLHFKNYSSVVKLCSSSISVRPTSKALYRRAVAYIELKEYEKAESDLIELLKVEPRNKAALDKYKLVRELDKSSRENYQSIIKKMFS